MWWDEVGEEDKEVQTSKSSISRSHMAKVPYGNVVNSIIITLDGDRW